MALNLGGSQKVVQQARPAQSATVPPPPPPGPIPPVHGPGRVMSPSSIMAIVAVIIIVALIGWRLGSSHLLHSASTAGAQAPEYVNVSGLAIASGAGTRVLQVVFTSAASGQSYTANVTGTQYNISLPNQDNYSVGENWAGSYGWQTGTNGTVGYLAVDQGPGAPPTLYYAVPQLATPSSAVSLSGSVGAPAGSTPLNVSFSASNGHRFNAMVSQFGDYNITLPNMLNYSVTLTYSNSTAPAGSCAAGSEDLANGTSPSYMSESWQC